MTIVVGYRLKGGDGVARRKAVYQDAGNFRTTTFSTSISSRSIYAARPEALTAAGNATPDTVPR
jgi:hypothetical protein